MLGIKTNKLSERILVVMFVLLSLQVVLAQNQNKSYKFAEYEKPLGGSCDEHFRMADFIEKVNQEEGSKGLVIIYSGNNTERYGNLLAYISGVEQYLTSRMGVEPGRVSFVIAEGKNLFNEEFWIIPQNSEAPRLNLSNWDSAKLQTKYHFSEAYLGCEPSYYLLTSFQPNFEGYARILKENPKYKGSITVGNFESLNKIRKILVGEYKLPRNRFSIQIKKGKNDEELGEDLYIVPSNN